MKSSDWLKTSTKLLLETFMPKGMFLCISVFSCEKKVVSEWMSVAECQMGFFFSYIMARTSYIG
jgi:hypothetical protein